MYTFEYRPYCCLQISARQSRARGGACCIMGALMLRSSTTCERWFDASVVLSATSSMYTCVCTSAAALAHVRYYSQLPQPVFQSHVDLYLISLSLYLSLSIYA